MNFNTKLFCIKGEEVGEDAVRYRMDNWRKKSASRSRDTGHFPADGAASAWGQSLSPALSRTEPVPSTALEPILSPALPRDRSCPQHCPAPPASGAGREGGLWPWSDSRLKQRWGSTRARGWSKGQTARKDGKREALKVEVVFNNQYLFTSELHLHLHINPVFTLF